MTLRRWTALQYRWAVLIMVAVLTAVLVNAAGTSDPVRAAATTTSCATSRPLEPGLSTHTIRHDDTTRRYAMYVPESYDGTRRSDVLFLFHGYGSDPQQVLRTTDMAKVADAEDFVVVAPLARGGSESSEWDFRSPGFVVNSDVNFTQTLVDTVRRTACVDQQGIFAAGFSNGAAFALALACDPDSQFAAYGAVSGPYIAPDCSRARPASIAYFHGMLDPVVPMDGAHTVIGPLPSVDSTVAQWVAHDQCPDAGATTTVKGPVKHFAWRGCADGSRISMYVLDDSGHRWPGQVDGAPAEGAAPEVENVDASRLMWSFFDQVKSATAQRRG